MTLGGKEVNLGGMCKGSGMIHPNMATMLGVVTCDASVDAEVWQGMVKRASVASFNQITVDGDTSTNDCVIGLASGLAGNATVTDAGSADGKKLEGALTALLQGLAKSIAWDGEGATCLIEVQAVGAKTDADARQVARSVTGSSLAKSAIFGGDPNWGRIAAAAGYSGVAFDQSNLGVRLGEQQLMEKGQPIPFDKAAASKYLKVCGESASRMWKSHPQEAKYLEVEEVTQAEGAGLGGCQFSQPRADSCGPVRLSSRLHAGSCATFGPMHVCASSS
mmetsp:Transcript_14167/g.41152  ORF Transcript_14167/g.41152 Transcript_14167/m.41152 type:complete len:277 (-) Transcript_14167:947-1777(-)